MKQKIKLSKKTLSASIATLLFASSAGWAGTIPGGTITFDGTVVTTACEVATGSFNVSLGEVGTNSLKAAGSEAPTKKDFSIQLTGCDTSVMKSVAVTFSGTPDSTDATALAPSGGTATKVAIRLYDNDGTKLNLGTASKSITLLDDQTSLNFKAALISPQGQATAGDVQATATYTLTYS
jgi:type 1 fimbria pilin